MKVPTSPPRTDRRTLLRETKPAALFGAGEKRETPRPKGATTRPPKDPPTTRSASPGLWWRPPPPSPPPPPPPPPPTRCWSTVKRCGITTRTSSRKTSHPKSDRRASRTIRAQCTTAWGRSWPDATPGESVLLLPIVQPEDEEVEWERCRSDHTRKMNAEPVYYF